MNEQTNNRFWKLINVLVVVLVIVGVVAAWATYRYGATLQPSRTISVSGEGKATAIPDIARISFSVVSEGKDPVVIADTNNTKINTALEFVKTYDIPAKDIKTTGYNLSPRYEYDEARHMSFISGYTLTQTVTVTIRNFSNIGSILAKLPELGINQIDGPNFAVDNDDAYLNVARKEAFDDAYAKAKAMAKQNGVSLSRVVTFSESFSGGPIGIYRSFGIGGDMEKAVAAPTIEPGSEEISVTVSVTYEIN
ncbi:MAG: SIMPL domain-containing protein [bacterium]|nr:SIMPL domain-containing protein [bacterium]